jgi:hypothetical protein
MFGCTVKRNIVNTNVYKTKISVAAALLSPSHNEIARNIFPSILRTDDACHAGQSLVCFIQDIPRTPAITRPNIGHIPRPGPWCRVPKSIYFADDHVTYIVDTVVEYPRTTNVRG